MPFTTTFPLPYLGVRSKVAAKDRFHSFISRGIFNDGLFIWTPGYLQSDNDYRVAIRNDRNKMVYDYSDRRFLLFLHKSLI